MPVIGAEGSPYLAKGKWQIFTGYRFQRSDRHFVGKVEQKQRYVIGNEVINTINLIDFAATYAVNQRFSLTVSAPLIFANRSQAISSAGKVVGRFSTQGNGIGDMSVTARTWLLKPTSHANENVTIGLGVKFPTGNSGVRDTFQTLAGPVERTIDQSVQPGDGGYGIVLEAQAFKYMWKTTFSIAGVYLLNPKNTNGVPTFRSNPYEAVMSVTDQYLVRVGAAVPVIPEYGLALTFGGRIEGVPIWDLIGGSDGFRRPGYAVSVEPGFIYSRGANSISLTAPFAVSRDRSRSVADRKVGGHGDAAFADYVILVGYSRRF